MSVHIGHRKHPRYRSSPSASVLHDHAALRSLSVWALYDNISQLVHRLDESRDI